MMRNAVKQETDNIHCVGGILVNERDLPCAASNAILSLLFQFSSELCAPEKNQMCFGYLGYSID